MPFINRYNEYFGGKGITYLYYFARSYAIVKLKSTLFLVFDNVPKEMVITPKSIVLGLLLYV